jgi:hypothetical protein
MVLMRGGDEMSWGCEGEASLVAQCSNSYPRPITAVRLKGSEDGYLTLGTKNENKKKYNMFFYF